MYKSNWSEVSIPKQVAGCIYVLRASGGCGFIVATYIRTVQYC